MWPSRIKAGMISIANADGQGFKSAIIPVLVLAVVIYFSFSTCDMYGVALAAIGFLSNLATGLTIDVYGPVCDNAGGKSIGLVLTVFNSEF